MALQIIRHAFLMIFNNLGQALRVSVGPYLLLIVGFGLFVWLSGFSDLLLMDQHAGTIGPAAIQALNPGTGLYAILLAVFALFVFGWVAVSWHRFILLEEYTGTLPAISGRPIWEYVWRNLLCGMVVILAAFPIIIVFGLISSPFGPVIANVLLILPVAILSYLWLRIALALPSVAVGQPIRMGQAWAASSKMSGVIFGLSLLLMGMNLFAGFVVNQIGEFAGIIAFVLDIVVQWVTFMLGISILTTLYGHLIEKRPLVD